MIASSFYFDLRNAEGLSREESVILFYQAKAGNMTAKDRLIESVLKLAWSIAKKFKKTGVPQEDFVAEASLCVVENWYKWIPEKSAFTTYIGACVKNRMKEFLWAKEHNGVYIPRHTIKDLRSTVHLARNSRREQQLKSARKVSKILLLSSLSKKDNISYDSQQTQNKFCLADLKDLLYNLDSLESQIIQLKSGLLGRPINFAEIAQHLKTSMTQVQKKYNSAIKKMRTIACIQS